jgi:hypothetical protein
VTQDQFEALRKYLDEDCQFHPKKGKGKWRLDAGKLQAALEHAGILIEEVRYVPALRSFDFVVGNINGPVSSSATIQAKSLKDAKEVLRGVMKKIQEAGAAAGVVTVHQEQACSLYFQITPEAVEDSSNWQEVR